MYKRLKTLSTLLLFTAASIPLAASATTFAVNGLFDDLDSHDMNPGDGVCADSFGGCQLRTAIEETNAWPGIDGIQLTVAGTITLNAAAGPLPAITERVNIYGYSAPGYNNAAVDIKDAPPVVYIDGSNIGGSTGSAAGLRFTAGSSSFSSVRAIGFTNFNTGISIGPAGDHLVIDACYIGVLGNGAAAGNATGISIATGGNRIGKHLDFGGLGNVISANTSFGVSFLQTSAEDANFVAGNRIGTTPNGVSARGNGIGIIGFGSFGNRIGVFNATLDYGNLISGNLGNGIQMTGSDNTIAANRIGINKNGAPLANGGKGIIVFGDNNVIGSTATNGDNLIANNTDGIVIDGGGSENNTITGNRVGSIVFEQGNSGDGIRIEGGAGNNVVENSVLNSGGDGIDVVSDSTMVVDNVVGFQNVSGFLNYGNDGEGIHVRSSNNQISGNTIGFSGDDGIDVEGFDNLMQFNFIGTTSDGLNIGNSGDGIGLDSAMGAISGNNTTFNTIAYNGEAGVKLGPGVGNDNTIYGNSIHSNAFIGIDLGPTGVTANDPDDGDIGPNKLQNWPTILSATINDNVWPTELTVQWRVDSATSNSAYNILADFYLADSAGNRQGRIYAGSDASATAPNTTVTSVLEFPMGLAGGFLVATATDLNGAGSTSEFSSTFMFGNPDRIFEDGFDP